MTTSGKGLIRLLENHVQRTHDSTRYPGLTEQRPPHSGLTILRRRQVEHETGYSRSTIYLRISQGLWTRPISLGARAVGWPAGEVSALNAARIAGLTDARIRELVHRLHLTRVGDPMLAAAMEER
ncbi:helix-turn-helix transcriptional regulator [Sphaerotilus microaerophilus]|uniref:helix-turn-helix transcriptional regulator n=1 Tax=Sphaerotilus microaerophilus TaxID=2914710 RepID=UPI0020740250|nr:AlpA family phage regulatory protein [Sphaerotilus sp. FB-5]